MTAQVPVAHSPPNPAAHSKHCPVLITLRVRDGVPILRRAGFVRAFRDSLRAASRRPGFRVVHYSIQDDHAHFLVEVNGRKCLANGMKSLGSRFVRCANAFRAERETGVRAAGRGVEVSATTTC